MRGRGMVVSRWLSALAALCVIVALGAPAWATIVRHVPLEGLIRISDAIATARVVDAQTFWSVSERQIITATTLEVERGWWGAPAKRIKVQQIGGTLGERTTRIPGDVQLARDERAVVFLKGPFRGERGDFYTFVALSQSRYTITGAGKDAVVKRELGDLAFMMGDGKTVKAIEEPPRGLASFEAELEALVAAIKGVRP